MRIALIKNGVVENVIEGDIAFAQTLGYDDAIDVTELHVGPGMRYNGTDFSPAVPHSIVPNSVTMRQARRALLAIGKLDVVAAAIASLPSPQREQAQIDWDYSQIVERTWPLVAMLAPALGMTDAQIDSLFIDAAGLAA